MSASHRLAEGGRVDRGQSLSFRFDGRRYTGFEGDTLASALLANGVDVVARSFKERRPRGILSAGWEEPNALVELGDGPHRTPSVRATAVALEEGMVARGQRGWPSLRFDLGAITGWLHPFLPAGFYNKTFLFPHWEIYEPFIRRMAGLGRAPERPDPERFAWRNTHCDLLVVGAGAAGLVAALTAAANGARVLLVESDREPGGSFLARRDLPGGLPPAAWVEELVHQLRALPNARLLLRTSVVGAYDHGVFAALEQRAPGSDPAHTPARWWRIRARRTILATGAIEQPLVFPLNDRPGIVLAGAARQYLNRYAVAVGRRIVVATNNDSAHEVALELAGAGLGVVAVVDSRPNVRAELTAALARNNIPLRTGATIQATRGRSRLRAAAVRSSGRTEWLDCDTLAVSGGWNPASALWGQAGGRLRFDADAACLVPDGALDGFAAVGAAAARLELHSALEHAAQVGAEAARALGHRDEIDARLWVAIEAESAAAPVGAIGCAAARRRDRAWVDLAHDVTAADVDLAVREGLTSVEHLKRYTTVGMAIDQGKTSNLNALAILAERSRRTIAEAGTTKFRPPVVPVTLGAIAGGRTGRFLRPARLLPTHDLQLAAGAQFEEYGLWSRPVGYSRAGESEAETIAREVRAVREAAGIFEASPLGKILVRGRDAATFLDRIYAHRIADLPLGRVRYGLMLTEKGVVMDDGVCARLGEHEFWVGSSSGNAVRVAAWLEEWLECQWPELDAVTTDVTSAWATITVAGPHAREIVAALGPDVDLSPAAFPHMSVRSGSLLGAPCHLFRVSFTGETSYEINVPAERGAALWQAALDAGRPFGAQPFGVEALLVLRTEKGYLHVGADTDGTTVPDDVGFAAAIARKEGDFVGRRSLALAENVRPDRLQLVGLRCDRDSVESGPFEAGAHLLSVPASGRVEPPATTEGYLTSACFSPTLGAHVGLGMLRSGRSRIGERVAVFDAGRTTIAEVVSPVHFDPAGERLRG